MAKKKEFDPYEIITDVSFRDEADGALTTEDLDAPKSKRPSGQRPMSYEFDDTKATLPKREEERLLDIYGAVLVKEFGPEDEYHSENQDPLMKRGQRIPMFSGKMVDFVNACREYIAVLFAYAEKQTYMPKELFLSMVENGSWKLDWLNKPDMNKYLRNKCSYESLLPYILDPSMDLTELEYLDADREYDSTGTQDIDFDDPVQLDQYRREIYPPELYEKLFVDRGWEDVPVYSDAILPDKYRIRILDDKESREFSKTYPEMMDALKSYAKKRRRNMQEQSHMFSGFASLYRTAEDDFELIENFEEFFGDESDRPPKFALHNIMSDEDEDALEEYLASVDEYIEDHELWEDDRGRTITKRELRNRQIRDILESKGINIRKFVNFSDLTVDPDKVRIELLDTEVRKPASKKEEVEDLIYRLYLKNRDKIDKREAKAMKKAKKRREFNDRHFGDGYIGSDDSYYSDSAGDALDEAIEYVGNQTMKEFFGKKRWKNVRDMASDMSDMSWDHMMGET